MITRTPSTETKIGSGVAEPIPYNVSSPSLWPHGSFFRLLEQYHDLCNVHHQTVFKTKDYRNKEAMRHKRPRTDHFQHQRGDSFISFR